MVFFLRIFHFLTQSPLNQIYFKININKLLFERLTYDVFSVFETLELSLFKTYKEYFKFLLFDKNIIEFAQKIFFYVFKKNSNYITKQYFFIRIFL